MRALIAARKSNKVSGAKDGHGISLDAQDELAREFCERQGWEIVGATQDIISGTVAPMKGKRKISAQDGRDRSGRRFEQTRQLLSSSPWQSGKRHKPRSDRA